MALGLSLQRFTPVASTIVAEHAVARAALLHVDSSAFVVYVGSVLYFALARFFASPLQVAYVRGLKSKNSSSLCSA